MKVFVILSLFLFFSCEKGTEPVVESEYFGLIGLEESYLAGELSTIEISESAPFVLVLCSGAFGEVELQRKDQNKSYLEVPSSISQKSGHYQLIVMSKNEILDRKSFSILPLSAVGEIGSLTGPKKLPSRGNKKSMTVMIPTDKFKNPVLEGQKIQVFYGDKGAGASVYTDNLLAYHEVGARGNQKLIFGAGIDEAFTEEQEILFDPMLGTNIQISKKYHYSIADKRQFVHLRTNEIFDALGHQIPDGSLVSWVVINHRGEVSNYSSYCINGIAQVYLQNPDKPEQWKVQANILRELKSNEVSLSFESAVASYQLTYKSGKVIIGPVLGHMGQSLSDGFPMKLTIEVGGETINKSVQLVDGFYEYEIPSKYKGEALDVNCEISGVVKTKTIYYEEE